MDKKSLEEENVKKIIFKESHNEGISKDTIIKGYDFNQGISYEKIFESYKGLGIQGSHMYKAVQIINNMLNWRGEEGEKCTIFFGYTSNMASCGIRDIIRYLCQHKLVNYIVTTTGGIEEDLIKCLADFYLGNFRMDDAWLREEGINRIGNMLVPNENYCKFEDWIMPILDEMWERQNKKGVNWTPSKAIDFLGEKINNEQSIYYWCHKNGIPVFCPAFTDGSLGDMLFCHSYRKQGLKIDLVEDIRKINQAAIHAKKSGVLILGAGVIKHHILNANMMRNGADYAVFINTAIEYDGSDSGALPNEAISWGKLRKDTEFVKIYSDATIAFPVIVAQTFAKYVEKNKAE